MYIQDRQQAKYSEIIGRTDYAEFEKNKIYYFDNIKHLGVRNIDDSNNNIENNFDFYLLCPEKKCENYSRDKIFTNVENTRLEIDNHDYVFQKYNFKK